jgi:hypothetical protein
LHKPQPLHKSATIIICSNAWQTPAGHLLSRIWASYSSLKYLYCTQNRIWCSLSQSAKSGRFYIFAQLLQFLDVAFLSLALSDAIQDFKHALGSDSAGGHLPQDSSTVKSRKNLAISTIQLSSSMTIKPPEPIIEPILCKRVVVNGCVQVLQLEYNRRTGPRSEQP